MRWYQKRTAKVLGKEIWPRIIVVGQMTDYSLTTTPGGRQGLTLLEARGSKKTINLTKERARILRDDYGLSICDISELVHANPLQVKAWIDA